MIFWMHTVSYLTFGNKDLNVFYFGLENLRACRNIDFWSFGPSNQKSFGIPTTQSYNYWLPFPIQKGSLMRCIDNSLVLLYLATLLFIDTTIQWKILVTQLSIRCCKYAYHHCIYICIFYGIHNGILGNFFRYHTLTQDTLCIPYTFRFAMIFTGGTT